MSIDLKGGPIALKIGIVIMALGVIVLLSGLYVVLSAPWDLISFEDYGSLSTYSLLFGDIFRLLNWLITTFMALVANLFLSGTALIIAGYALYRVPQIQKQQDLAKTPQ